MCLVPINLGNMHWIAAVINFKQKRIEYFDSMGDYGDGMQDVFYVSHTLHRGVSIC
jgi:sentrin-specific protease 1